jgi:4'-phosphopantetheinyl transferase
MPANMNLQESDVHVWYARPEQVFELQCWRYLLDERDQVQHDAYRFNADRDLFLLSRAILRTTLSRYEPVSPATWRFTNSEYGRPLIAGPVGATPLYFSISHTAGVALVAFGRTPLIGADVEKLDQSIETLAIANDVLRAPELERLLASPVHERLRLFLRYWTLKEAYAKARSLGLGLPFNRIGFDLNASGPRLCANEVAQDGGIARWYFSELDLGSAHVGAVAVDAAFSLRIQAWNGGAIVGQSVSS